MGIYPSRLRSRKVEKSHESDKKKGDSERSLETGKKHDGVETVVPTWKRGDLSHRIKNMISEYKIIFRNYLFTFLYKTVTRNRMCVYSNCNF